MANLQTDGHYEDKAEEFFGGLVVLGEPAAVF